MTDAIGYYSYGFISNPGEVPASQSVKTLKLRTFAPIATAHFFAHVTHSSCIADHEGNKHGIEAQTFPRRKERKSMWHHGIVVDPGLLGNVTQLVTV